MIFSSDDDNAEWDMNLSSNASLTISFTYTAVGGCESPSPENWAHLAKQAHILGSCCRLLSRQTRIALFAGSEVHGGHCQNTCQTQLPACVVMQSHTYTCLLVCDGWESRCKITEWLYWNEAFCEFPFLFLSLSHSPPLPVFTFPGPWRSKCMEGEAERVLSILQDAELLSNWKGKPANEIMEGQSRLALWSDKKGVATECSMGQQG